MRKFLFLAMILFVAAMTNGQSIPESTGASTTYPFESAINSEWQYNSSANVYYIVGIIYCATPASSSYQQMGIYVPAAYMNATANGNGTYTCTINQTATVNGFKASTAPIVIPVNTPAYAAQAAPTGYSSSVASYTAKGFIYLWPGCRGKNHGAPLGVTDLKAAVRYFRYLQAEQNAVPGNADRMFSFGHSGGGAQSSILGASGNSSLFDPYLTSIGAEDQYKDNICGSMCWCPITNLDQGGEAYEWNMGLTRTGLSSANTSISKGSAEDFATYVNNIQFKHPTTGATLSLASTSNGYYQSGSYYEYVIEVINDAITRYNFYNSASVPLYSTTDQTALYSFASTYKKATKGLGAFDDYDQLNTPENTLFGIAGTAGHFDSFLGELVNTYASSYYPSFVSALSSSNVDAHGKTVHQRLMQYTPVYFLLNNSTYYNGGGMGSSDVAPYWRIRTGIKQTDAGLSTEINLALALKNYTGVKDVDFETIWNQGHTMAEDTGTGEANFIAWVIEVCNTATGINTTQNADNAIKAYSVGKTIYINGVSTSSDITLYSITGMVVKEATLSGEPISVIKANELTNGYYILRVNTNGKVHSFKLSLVD